MEGSIWGAENEFASSARLDDLQCAFASLKGFLGAQKQDCIAVHCVLDNEEVGSGTKQERHPPSSKTHFSVSTAGLEGHTRNI